MSRRSLRLHSPGGHYGDNSLSSLSRNATYSAGATGWKESRSVRSKKLQSQSLQLTPRRSQCGSALQGHSLHSCTASDTSLMSSLLDESCIQEHTLVDSFWGLDEDTDIKERTVLSDRSFTLANGDITMMQVAVTDGYVYSDCATHDERGIALTACSHSAPPEPPSTVYSRDMRQKHKSGVFLSLWGTCLAFVLSVIMLLLRAMWSRVPRECKGFTTSLYNTCLLYGRTVAVSSVSLVTWLTRGVQLKMGYRGPAVCHPAHPSYCRSMNVSEPMAGDQQLSLHGSLCDDCKRKQHLETRAIVTQSSRARCLVGVLWRVLTYTGLHLLHAARTMASAVWLLTQSLLSFLWLAAVSAGQAAARVLWWLGTGWYQLVTLMSLFNIFTLTRPYRLLLLVPILLVLGLWYWPPVSVLSYLPALNLTVWGTASPAPLELVSEDAPGSSSGAPTTLPSAASQGDGADSGRLDQLERHLAQLGESVQRGGQQQEHRHAEVLSLYRSLREELDRRTDKDSTSLVVSDLMEERLALLTGVLPQDAVKRQDLELQAHTSRLARLEELFRALEAKAEEVLQKMPAPVEDRVPVDSEAHHALLADVQRLEEELGRVKADLQGVLGCQGRCSHLDSLHDTVSALVRQELQTLLGGSEQADQLPEPPKHLLQLLTTQFVHGADLQATLAAMELSVLRNISLQVEQTGQLPCTHVVTDTMAQAGISEEYVHHIVQNALKLYSQDRTGMVDYALESGGGSILSTRYSETYETKTALMSLFGFPLWYFSQSPRVVIQPDVYPGNCWAFRGSQGFLVIRLSLRVLPTAFSLEHVSKSLSPSGNITSAPCHFSVHGLEDESQEEGKLLGRYTYQEDGDSLQTFPVLEENEQAYQIIEVRILSNWGHPLYTCLYRFRVHGEPQT